MGKKNYLCYAAMIKKQAQESFGSCDELLSAKLIDLDGAIKK